MDVPDEPYGDVAGYYDERPDGEVDHAPAALGALAGGVRPDESEDFVVRGTWEAVAATGGGGWGGGGSAELVVERGAEVETGTDAVLGAGGGLEISAVFEGEEGCGVVVAVGSVGGR